MDITLIPTTTNGGQTSNYSMLISYIATDLQNVVGLNVTFPDEYTIAPGSVSCFSQTGFSPAGSIECGVFQANMLYISLTKLDTAQGIASLTLTDVMNPIIDQATYMFSFSKGNSANSSLSRFTKSFTFTFVPPTISVETVTFENSTVFTGGNKAYFTFAPIYTIKRGSFLLITLPTGGMIEAAGGAVECTGIMRINQSNFFLTSLIVHLRSQHSEHCRQ